MANAAGALVRVPVGELLADASLQLLTPSRRGAPLPPRGVLDGLPAEVVARAQWWEGHVVEVLPGAVPGCRHGATPRPQYNPLHTSLRQREVDKVAELRAEGELVSLRTLGRMRRRYQADGLLGLVDGRLTGGPDKTTDARVMVAIEKAVPAQTDRSTGTVSRLRRRVEKILTNECGIDPAQVMPSRATFYRLVRQVAAGRHTFGSAPTRRSLAQPPAGRSAR